MKEKLKELDIPEKPKRPLSPYIRFSVEQRDDLKKKFPNLNMIEITKKCANEWQNMSVDLKEKYIASFRTDLDVYTKKIDAYTENLTEEQKAFIKLVNKEKQEDRKKKQLRKVCFIKFYFIYFLLSILSVSSQIIINTLFSTVLFSLLILLIFSL